MPFLSSHARNRVSLSRQEMCIISQEISRNFSPRLFGSRIGRQAKRRFTPQELLEISQQISREYAPRKISLPSRLVLLSVSPRRLHAYWHVAKRRLKAEAQSSESVEPMTLRIYTEQKPQVLPVSSVAAEPGWFDVIVNREEGQQSICLPENMAGATDLQYRAALGDIEGDHVFSPQLFSNTTFSPHIMPQEAHIELPNAIAQFIMPDSNLASSAGKTASGQGK